MHVPKEPIFRCFQDDLDKDDPRYMGRSLYCIDCRHMVWCEAPGEYMTAWMDTRVGPICLDCFYIRYKAKPVYDGTDKWDELDEYSCWAYPTHPWGQCTCRGECDCPDCKGDGLARG